MNLKGLQQNSHLFPVKNLSVPSIKSPSIKTFGDFGSVSDIEFFASSNAELIISKFGLRPLIQKMPFAIESMSCAIV